MNIAIFGLGYVGAVTAACLARNGHRVIGVDTDDRKLDLIRSGNAPIIEEGIDDLVRSTTQSGALSVTGSAMQAVGATDFALVCVGTPSAPDGSLDTRYVERVSQEIGSAIRQHGKYYSVVIRSTVAPGTTENIVRPILQQTAGRAGEAFGLSMNPEFLREGSSIRDFDEPPFTVIGTPDETEFHRIAAIYDGTPGEVIHCAVATAESVKYACNLYHATKITFANEIGLICSSLGVDAREVMELMCRDTKLNVSHRYLRPGFAFGGSCLPKDIRAFGAISRTRSVPAPLLESLLRSNQEQVLRCAQRIIKKGRRRVSMLGISFKEGTDDLRESPLVSLAEILIGKGFDVRIYDPNVEYAALYGANRRFIDRELPHLKSALCSPEELLAHGEIVVIGHRAPAYLPILDRIRSDQIVFDLVGVADAGITCEYEGLYW